ncbi:MAG: glycosyltransferase 87 family protein [Candidatus Kapaibacteriota bacterium]
MSIDVTKRKSPWIIFSIYLLGFMVYAFIPAERNAVNMQMFLGVYGIHALFGLLLLRKADILASVPALFTLFLFSRVAMFFMYPWLSDDIFGYVFYGKATLAGENLYALKADDASLTYLRDSAYALMAFKPYQNIYPPIATIFMTISAWISSLLTNSLSTTILIWKAILFCSEFLGLALLYRWLKQQNYSLLPILFYLAIPMTAVEGIGQAHNELLLLPFIIGSIMLFRETASHTRNILIGGMCAILGLIKLYPIVLIIPFLIKARKLNTICSMIIGAILIVILSSAPWFWGIMLGNFTAIQGYISVLQFYQGTYFNGVILYGLRFFLESLHIHEWWLVAPKVLTFFRIVSIITMSIHSFIRKRTLVQSLYSILLITVLISAKVHPWYFIPVIFLAAMIHKQSILMIGSLMMFTYTMYAVDPVQESMLFESSLWVICGIIVYLDHKHSLHIFNRDQCEILP